MNLTPQAEAEAQEPAGPSLSPLGRCVAIFTRPASAWTGLERRAAWWFPMLVMVGFAVLSSLLLYHRALIPMLTEGWEQQVANGQMQAEQLDQIEKFFDSPAGLAFSVGQQVVILPIMILVIALGIWFGVGFVLGTGMKYRLALEVACWSSLIWLPTQILTTVLAWFKETLRGVHVGFGVLLPEVDPPTKLHVALGAFLDALGPLAIWYLVVSVLGAAALSGAPRRSAGWTLGVLYLVIMGLIAALTAVATPAAAS